MTNRHYQEMSQWLLGVALCGLATSPAIAQDLPSSSADRGPSVQGGNVDSGEIVVTARRREERLQDVPIAITAFGKHQLEDRQIASEIDLQRTVPGLTIRQSGNANQFNYSLRGQSVDTYTNSPPGVLPYINEVQIVSHSSSAFYDLESIQVLKGPQGTLFGRNTTGGAVLFDTAKPDNELDGHVIARYGNFDAVYAEAAVSLPISDQVGLRLAGSYTGGGAFVRNLLTDRRLGKQNIRSGRATLVLRPTQSLTSTTVVQTTREGGNNIPTMLYSAYRCGDTFKGVPLTCTSDALYSPAAAGFQAFIAAHPNLYPNGVADFADLQRARGPWTAAVNVPSYHRALSTFVMNTTSLEISSMLTLKNIIGFNKSRADDAFDYDGSPYPIFQTGGTFTADMTSMVDQKGFIQDTKQFSDELQLQGKAFGDKLVYVLGAYYSKQRDINDSAIYAFDFSPVAAGSQFSYDAKTRSSSKAIFGQATYQLTDRLSVTGGIRYTWDKQSQRQLANSVFGTASPVERAKSSAPSWTVNVDYQLTPDIHVYAAHRGSWRSGGYNYSVNPVNLTAADGGNRFVPEKTKDIELGVKYSGRGLGIPVTFNTAVYNQWVSNVQRAGFIVGVAGTATLVTVNVPRAEVTGVEIDMSARPAQWLNIGASGAYTKARYTNGRVALFGNLAFYGPYADTPKWTGNAYVEVTHELPADAGQIKLHVDGSIQSDFFMSNLAGSSAPKTTIDGYVLVDGRLSWANMWGSGITSALFVRNLFNKRYYTGGNPLGNQIGINTSVSGRPRMWGVELRADF